MVESLTPYTGAAHPITQRKRDIMTKFDMRRLREVQPDWFCCKNRRFFGDVSYRTLRGKLTGNIFLVRSTYAWTDMFGGPRRLHYRINTVGDDYVIGNLIDKTFRDIDDVKEYLKTA